ncbi:S-layer homology domain-containing protein [Candidatus Vampirococcus lugosii]|uniref:SLH domain-containing protein n=1 Tax=Candidatus Vampirococcus lugosii TaxID=2789015 RepID=A0ABS5QL89_9BACT|nr:S-layer homology domain-containing protein [Candidatus Vampirococcus lugosii]MBS8121764.1 hypothetical protein [Candidatus Vampirococcus lugosii]
MNKGFIYKGIVEKIFATGLILIALYITGAVSVFGEFWRAIPGNPFVALNDGTDGEFKYGYGYGALGWGNGYGYGYGYGNDAGYYIGNKEFLDASNLGSVSIVEGGDITNTAKITMKADVVISTGNIKVTLPEGLEITDSDGNSFDATSIATDVLNELSVGLDSNENKEGALKFGVSGIKLNFSKPVKIEIPVPGINTNSIKVKVKHANSTAYSTSALTNSASVNCTNGTPDSNASDNANISNEIATIYTCSASEFVAYTTSSRGGGGGGAIWETPDGNNNQDDGNEEIDQNEDDDQENDSDENVDGNDGETGGNSGNVDGNTNIDGNDGETDISDETKQEIDSVETNSESMTVNQTDIIIEIPVFQNANTQSVIDSLNSVIIKEILERKISGKDLENLVNNYNKFLSVVKLIKEGNADSIIKQAGKRYLSNITSILYSYEKIITSYELQDEEFELALAFLKRYGLTKYNSVDEFRPFDELTRQESAKFFAGFGGEVLGLESTNNNCSFNDISNADYTLVPKILSVCAMGIMKGFENEFSPFDNITRAESFTVLVRAILGEKLDENVNPRWDNYFKIAQELNLTIENNTWEQDRSITRYEMSLIIYRAWLKLNN